MSARRARRPRSRSGRQAVAAVARGASAQPQAQPASVGTTVAKPAQPPAAPTPEAPRDVVPFGEGMTRPVLMQSGRSITYTREAIAARVEGVSIVRCVITAEGAVEHCKVIKPLPFMDDAVVEHLQSQRFQPVTYQGHPVSVGYNFSVRLALPVGRSRSTGRRRRGVRALSPERASCQGTSNRASARPALS